MTAGTKAAALAADRELLEAAARAAGIAVDWRGTVKCLCYSDSPYNIAWNPLADDADEARLEAVLQMHVEWHPARATVRVGTAAVACIEPYGKDRQAARRRAGVRAAAALDTETKP